jgi:RNA polymerase sigma-70 factor (ECF subfamily)
MLCRSRALDRWRQHRTDTIALNVVASTEAARSSTDQSYDILSLIQQRTSMHAALAQLTPERRHLVSLAFLHGMSHQEIADALRLPLGTVKSHVRRALSQLRESLEAM